MEHATGRLAATPRWRFRLSDSLILVAAFGVALALSRSLVWPGVPRFLFDQPDEPSWKKYLSSYYVLGIGSRFSSMLAIGLLIVFLRAPRPGLRKLFRQPGAVACLAVVVTMVVNGIQAGAWVLFRTVAIGGVTDSFQPVWESRIAPAVVAAWTALWLGGRWRAEPSALDRAGRLVGLYWVYFAASAWIDLDMLSRVTSEWWAR
jgi:hypothetical protein